jgi:hypothetical protein
MVHTAFKAVACSHYLHFGETIVGNVIEIQSLIRLTYLFDEDIFFSRLGIKDPTRPYMGSRSLWGQ